MNNIFIMYKTNEEYNKTFVKTIIQYAAIEDYLWCRHSKEYETNINYAIEEIETFLNNQIENISNKEIYKNIIEKLKDYFIEIIKTNWFNTDQYTNHIFYIKNLFDKYKVDSPTKIKCKNIPFGKKLPLDLQEYILKIKYNKQVELYNLYLFLLNNFSSLLDYLEEKKIYALNKKN